MFDDPPIDRTVTSFAQVRTVYAERSNTSCRILIEGAMAEMIPMHVVERLEREWRLIEPQRDINKPSG